MNHEPATARGLPSRGGRFETSGTHSWSGFGFRVQSLPAWLLLLVLCAACGRSERDASTLFTRLGADATNVSFVNRVEDEPDFNPLDYLYFYDGGGVAIGDVNNDSLPDLFFTGNQVANKLYLNKGNFEFEDVTAQAGVGGDPDAWSTGVTMADVNGDGWMDIYVCQVHHRSKEGHNLLYINDGDGTFTERAQQYGLDFEGLSTQAAFFDYDRDGDLDLYLLNHSVHSRDTFRRAWRRIIDAPRAGDKLYRQEASGRFTDVTEKAGIYSSVLGYGLGLAISDINYDGWPDIYVGNDFHENDYLYVNNGDGTFSDSLQRVIGHTSRSSMGNDVADVNNDGRVDIVSLDMLPGDLETYRQSGGVDDEELAQIKRDFGYAPQYARNTLQLHRGRGPQGHSLFSEIGRYAGIHATDWSWAGLLADLDNDGWKDLVVTNGIFRRPNDLDYIEYISRPEVQRRLNQAPIDEQLQIARRMPSVKISNYAFKNNGDLTFTDRAAEWGLGAPSFSNGAAYGDLDNDGDLDLVVNNVNMAAFVYRNNSDTLRSGHYLTVALHGAGDNTSGIGAKVIIEAGGERLYQEQMPTRGFQSSVSHTLHVGLGAHAEVDSLLVVWPDGRFQRLYQVEANQRLDLWQRDAKGMYPYEQQPATTPYFEDVTAQAGVEFRHQENDPQDFKRHPLLPHALSTEGPALAIGDVDGDGRDDMYVGGARGQAGALFRQREAGRFEASDASVFRPDRDHEDVDATFMDVDGDGDLDLYVVSGGGDLEVGHRLLQDRLYLNDGTGQFTRSEGHLPVLRADGACVAAADYDGDGDVDLFVGSRSVPRQYGVSPESYLLENDGSGQFDDVTQARAPELQRIGMVTDAQWADIDGTGELDLVVAGEWMPITVFSNEGGEMVDATEALGLSPSSGWWNTVRAADFDGDGDVDLMAGNLGTNSIFRAAEAAPLMLFVDDFDGNGTTDPILAEDIDGHLYTWARRDELLEQIPSLREQLPTYEAYADRTVSDLFGPEALQAATVKTAATLASSYFERREEGFERRALPQEVQFAPVQSLLAMDFDRDEDTDVILGGNRFKTDRKQGRYDASYGTLLRGDGKGRFSAIPLDGRQFILRGEVRGMDVLRAGEVVLVAVARNDAPLQLFRLRPPQRGQVGRR